MLQSAYFWEHSNQQEIWAILDCKCLRAFKAASLNHHYFRSYKCTDQKWKSWQHLFFISLLFSLSLNTVRKDKNNENVFSLSTLDGSGWNRILKVSLQVIGKYCLMSKLSTSIYDLVLINVCHFHHFLLLQWQLFNFEYYRDTRAYILDLASRNFQYCFLSYFSLPLICSL